MYKDEELFKFKTQNKIRNLLMRRYVIFFTVWLCIFIILLLYL